LHHSVVAAFSFDRHHLARFELGQFAAIPASVAYVVVLSGEKTPVPSDGILPPAEIIGGLRFQFGFGQAGRVPLAIEYPAVPMEWLWRLRKRKQQLMH
jgi:hypothetical protein